MKYSTYAWDLVQALESASPAPCKIPATLTPSTKTINQTKAKNPEMRFNFQQIMSYSLGLSTQNLSLRETWNPVLREVMAISICWNMEERPQKKTIHIKQPGHTYGFHHLDNCLKVIISHQSVILLQKSALTPWNLRFRDLCRQHTDSVNGLLQLLLAGK